MEKQQTAVALGFFDGVHQGHRRVIEKAVSLANGHLIPAVFTFTMHEGGPSKKQGAGESFTGNRYWIGKGTAKLHLLCLSKRVG